MCRSSRWPEDHLRFDFGTKNFAILAFVSSAWLEAALDLPSCGTGVGVAMATIRGPLAHGVEELALLELTSVQAQDSMGTKATASSSSVAAAAGPASIFIVRLGFAMRAIMTV